MMNDNNNYTFQGGQCNYIKPVKLSTIGQWDGNRASQIKRHHVLITMPIGPCIPCESYVLV